MALLNSLFSGVSGLQNLQAMMDVIGNNIANVDTIGFKGSRVTFSDTFNDFIKSGTNPTNSSGGTNSFQIGLGMKINSIDRNWNQGTFERTGITTDLALQGPGMFILKSNGQNFYSRAGAFEFDSNGKLVDPQNGAVVQGKVANGLGQIPQGTTIQDIVIDKNLKLPAIKTANVSWGGNLQSSSPVTRTNTVDLEGNLQMPSPAAAGTYPGAAYSASDIYNQNGDAYTLRSWYTRDNSNNWTLNYDIYSADNKTQLASFSGPKSQAMTLDSNGNFTIATPNITDSTDNLNFNFGVSTLTHSIGTSSVTAVVNNGETPTPVIGSVTIYDSLGNPHTLTVEYDHIDSNKWSWKASIPSADGQLSTPSQGQIIFDPNGTIQSVLYQNSSTVPTTYSPVSTTPPNPQFTFTPANGSEAQPLTLNFGSGTSGITQTSLSSQIAALTQDGSPSATLSNLNIDQYGNIVGVFSNGNSRTLGQIMVATFTNLNGLVSSGDNLYSVAANSGDPRIDTPGQNSATTIQSGALEQSNVDLSNEFTKMIVSQRGFQANARVITTADSLLQEITNLIR
ncbi:MAG: flagellar hook protein FlgE [Bacteroidetes bacterium]|nr:flagellar hook protein FlgE [Bacteroidota bacterium]